MALQTIQGNTFQEFITNFTSAVTAGSRFKTCNFYESDKESFTKLEDFNFFTNIEGIHDITGDGGYLLEVENTYVLPVNVDVTTQLDLIPDLTLGAYLMSIQYFIEAGNPLKRHITQPSKARIAAFAGDLRGQLIPNCGFTTSEDYWVDYVGSGATHSLYRGQLKVNTLSGGVHTLEDQLPTVDGSSYKVVVDVATLANEGADLISYYPVFPSNSGVITHVLSLGFNTFDFTAVGAGGTIYLTSSTTSEIVVNSVCVYDNITYLTGGFPFTFNFNLT